MLVVTVAYVCSNRIAIGVQQPSLEGELSKHDVRASTLQSYVYQDILRKSELKGS